MTEINIEYLISELVKAEIWKAGCLKVFGEELHSCEEMAAKVKEVGRHEIYRNSTFTDAAVRSPQNFEEYCEQKVYVPSSSPVLTSAMILKEFKKELKADYDTYRKEND